MAFLVSVLVSFLPLRYRGWWRHAESAEMGRAASASGLLEGLLAVFFLVAGFINYAPEAWIGPLAWMEYFFHPSSMLLAYLFLEGLVRFLVGLITGEAVGTLPLVLVACTHTWLEARRAQQALGTLVADTVDRAKGKDYDLRIASCRPKPNWDRLMTVAFEDTHYEVVREEPGSSPRRFVYLLRKAPPGKVIRGLHHYDPNEPLAKLRGPTGAA